MKQDKHIIIQIAVYLSFLSGSWILAQQSNPGTDASSPLKQEATIQGQVVDDKGEGIEGIDVDCIYYRGDFPMSSIAHAVTSEEGRYVFHVPELTYHIAAGGTNSTHAESQPFPVKKLDVHTVETLKVRPAKNRCHVKVMWEDGRPAANLTCGYASGSFSPIDHRNPPKTDERGEYDIDHLLSDELFSFWVFPEDNTLCVWKRLDPNREKMECTVRPDEYIILPSDWLMFFTHTAIALDMTIAKDSRIQFCLPDLEGWPVSLSDSRFKNKAVLVNAFGSWCSGCRQEIPFLVEWLKKYQKEGLEIIGIAFERGSAEEGKKAVREIAQKYQINYTLLFGGSVQRDKMGETIHGLEYFDGYPTTIYMDRTGVVRHIQVGFWIVTDIHKQWQLKQMEEQIQKILQE